MCLANSARFELKFGLAMPSLPDSPLSEILKLSESNLISFQRTQWIWVISH